MDRAGLLALAERVESATGADREIDCQVCEAIGLIVERGTRAGRSSFTTIKVLIETRWKSVPQYTASLDAVRALCTEKLPGWGVTLNVGAAVPGVPERQWLAFVSLGGPGDVPFGKAATPALAFLAAFLRAIATTAAPGGEGVAS